MKNYVLDKYCGRWAVFCNTTRCWVLFGPRKVLERRVRELNEQGVVKKSHQKLRPGVAESLKS